MNSSNALRFVRSLALLSPLAALGCNDFPPECDATRAVSEASNPAGGAASASAAAQCSAPGPSGSACTEAVQCGPTANCCGRWVCQAGTVDGGAVFLWQQQFCAGPLAPPSLA